MNIRTALYCICFFLPALPGAAQQVIDKFTGINPVSYTAVVYTGRHDTVLVATPSGRIARVIKGSGERVVAQLHDEIYALAYNKRTSEIAAATLENGVVLLDGKSGRITRKLALPATWTIALCYSDDYKWLATFDQDARPHVWEVQEGYKELQLPDSFPKGTIIAIDSHNMATIASPKKLCFWDLKRRQLQESREIPAGKVMDKDAGGNVLIIDFNQCINYSSRQKAVVFSLQHPDWPYHDLEDSSKVYRAPYHMQLNAARFTPTRIYTAGIDRTIRVWDKASGKLLQTLTGHSGSVSKLKVSEDGKQVVSVDLKGILKFWDAE
ncbi:WD40 repeat domain-containing protein [Taibaiella helva]|uniref:WD40 repeat domain-containing protein n=1 Tax=Taibaiella helva TaxID=2301235 RepID=UPI001300BD2E|nr:hypothetical protein [Taibaiella helva]